MTEVDVGGPLSRSPLSEPALAPFELLLPARVLFGAGKRNEVAKTLRALGLARVLFVTGKDATRSAVLRAELESVGCTLTLLSVPGEPSVELARSGASLAREHDCQAVVALGGGSVIDAGKAVAALATNTGDPLDYLEVIGKGQALRLPSLPFVAIPSTAGTGSEVTRNAVLGSSEAGVKASLRSPFMLPALAVVDPDLLIGSPPSVLCASGLDALSQLIEPLLSVRAQPFSDALARAGIVASVRSLRRAVLDGPDAAARADLALASLFGGLCLANAGLGAVHGFAAPLGGMFAAPHGAVCAALLPHVMHVNLRAVRARAPHLLARFDELAVLLTGRPTATADDGIAWLRELCSALSVPGLASYGLDMSKVQELVTKAQHASSMKGNPLPLTVEELNEIACAAL